MNKLMPNVMLGCLHTHQVQATYLVIVKYLNISKLIFTPF